MSLTEELQTSCSATWNAVTQHQFCRELSDGTLADSRMAAYLVQDYTFLDNFVRLAASAIAHAPTLQDSIPLAQFLAVVTGPENTYFHRSFEALAVTEQDWKEPELWPATQGFQAIMTEARLSGSYSRMIAVLVVAEWSYLEWATPFHPAPETLPFYLAEWITLHAGPEFEGLVAYLRGQLEAAWPTLDAEEKEAVTDIFHRTVSLEKAFFDTALTP
ncbi:TenA family protein [Granulosicoccus antarcticus]|uniref:Aminopyrimidine aminohydrolase n=1 Tax=Granulosicoccus antarcticus IMCC3135 TaxID=1192854 RepID=A0A2Z2NM55_9GAMM|nr:TenA family protein [Granulosicoccus antarcticus]ASJ70858.1 Aminopyrimidine aminohydrolase [Granulosicoccus antarcticus IMCC3135]